MRAEVITIGDELLSGSAKFLDTNSVYIAQALHRVGVDVLYRTTVGDHEGRIVEVLRIAAARVNLIVTTGGLGPTVDDRTRQAVAAATGRALVFHQALLDQIAARFKRFGVRMSENNRQQAYLPEGAIPIENPVGTAPCFIVEDGDNVIVSLPGVPSEMTYLMTHTVMPYLIDRFALSGVIKTRILRTAGMGESQLDALIGDLMKLDNPIVGVAAHPGQTDIRVTATAASEAEADALIASVEQTIRERVARYIFGVEDDTLEDVLIDGLRRRGLAVATVEAGTGRALAALLGSLNGVSAVVCAADAYDSTPALCAILERGGAPDDLEALARHAADWVRRGHGAAIGLAVVSTPDDAEDAPGGVGGTAIAAVADWGVRVRRYGFGGHQGNAPDWVPTHALAMAWHLLMDKDAAP
ncbi:MAG: CinA family nicotinamide mononucleotide deamidase-related protein [Anaerolineae bacterium]|nr:CinA family nicotinamide mononucleotide deamidase-related protein [Anaerolineae bacterium]